MPVQNLNQLVPAGIPESKSVKIFADSLTEIVFPHVIHKVTHHNRCLVVDDIAIDKPCICKIVKPLPDRGSSACTVVRHRRNIVVLKPDMVVVDFREHRLSHLDRKIVGIDLLCPHIVEPPHRYHVPEPHVRGLVGNQIDSFFPLVKCRIFV